MKDLYLLLYEKMCWGCMYKKSCHESCENCDDFLEELEKLES